MSPIEGRTDKEDIRSGFGVMSPSLSPEGNTFFLESELIKIL